jgi:endonuclease-3
LKKADIFEFFRRLAEANPSPETELAFGNTYQLLVAVVLSAQSTDVGVNKATRALFREVKTPQEMIALGEDGLKQHIRTIGLFNSKARNVIALSEKLVAEHGGAVPTDRDTLVTLPGVGRKTANVVMNCAFGEETFAVDTHVFRVCNRTGLARGKTPEQVEAKLDKRVPQPFRRHAHHWLILHGRYTCKARLPECWRCPVIDLCRYKPKTLPPEERAKVRSSAARTASRGRSTVRTATGRKPRTPSAGRSRARPTRLP